MQSFGFLLSSSVFDKYKDALFISSCCTCNYLPRCCVICILETEFSSVDHFVHWTILISTLTVTYTIQFVFNGQFSIFFYLAMCYFYTRGSYCVGDWANCWETWQQQNHENKGQWLSECVFPCKHHMMNKPFPQVQNDVAVFNCGSVSKPRLRKCFCQCFTRATFFPLTWCYSVLVLNVALWLK